MITKRMDVPAEPVQTVVEATGDLVVVVGFPEGILPHTFAQRVIKALGENVTLASRTPNKPAALDVLVVETKMGSPENYIAAINGIIAQTGTDALDMSSQRG